MNAVALLYLSGKVTDQQQWSRLKELTGGQHIGLPDQQPAGSGLMAGAELTLLGKRYPLLAEGQGTKSPVFKAAGGSPIVVAPESHAAWLSLDKGIGPLNLNRIGVAYADHSVWLLVDAGLTIGGLAFTAQGLGLGISLKEPLEVRGCLRGLSLDYDRDPVRIAAGVLLQEPPAHYHLLLTGIAEVITPQLNVAAVASYAERDDGGVSLAVFGKVGGLHIGTPVLELTGLAGGFGYNSRIAVPELAAVEDFPLIAGIADDSKFPVGKGAVAVLDAMRDVITPEPGSLWFAAGAQFTAFEFIDGSLLAVLQAGDDFTLSVLGIVGAQFPKKHPYAKAALELRAVYRHSTGELSFAGQFTRDSYVLDPSCHIEGGFAYATWVDPSVHRGDFVVSFGGYHPSFRRPGHYPDVKRVGLRWAVSDAVSINGEGYAALTPWSFMLGGRLAVDFHAGPLSAWFHAQCDALIQWSPFHFELDVGIRVGFALDVWIGTIRGELGVDLSLWGPPTGGIATVHVPVLGGIHIRFGEGRGSKPPRLTWSEFVDGPLHGGQLQVLPLTGVRPPVPDAENEARPWKASQSGFALATRSPMPFSAHSQQPGSARGNGVDVRPLGWKGASVTHALAVKGPYKKPVDLVKAGWDAKPTTEQVPTSVWGEPLTDAGTRPPTPQGAGTVCAQTGMRLTVPPPRTTGPLTPIIAEDTLSFEDVVFTDGEEALIAQHTRPVGPTAARPGTVRQAIRATMAAPDTAARRDQLRQALAAAGILPATALTGRPVDFPDRVWSYVLDEPLSAVSQR
ncbi:DUF6603 domain-containing protein [Streptomyces noursei]|uniref:DUF6603 domain-containing protein n=1 Tax=Streptomyces noursei TaxID=1971 RepID=UPI003827BBBA